MPKPDLSAIEHPCVWRGAELFNRPDWERQFNGEQLAELEAGHAMPSVGALLREIAHDLEHGAGAVLLRGLPVENYDDRGARSLFLKLAGQVGRPVSQSAAGELVFSVRDAGFADDDPRSRGPNTRKKLSFHSDRCDVIGFLCLKQAKRGGENDVVSSAAIYNELLATRPDLVEALCEPFYYKRHTVDTGNERPYCRQPIFSVTRGHFACNLLRVLIDRAYADPETPDMTPLQREALDAVEQVASRPDMHASFRQEPGDIVFLNNWVTLHRRSEFEDHTEPERKRHILRVWLSPANNRPLDPLFADNYGDTTAGAVRGGMRASS